MLQTDIKKLLGLVVISFFFITLLILFFVQIPTANSDLVKTFGVALISAASMVVGYYFGSSEGSARKTELMTPPSIAGEAILASLPDKSEGGFIRLPLLFASLLICASVLFAACATTTPTSPPTVQDGPQILAGKSLLAVKSTIVTAASAADAFCKAGTLPADKCAQAKIAYETAKPAYDAAVDAYLLMSSTGGDPAAFGAALTRVQSLAANLLALSGGVK